MTTPELSQTILGIGEAMVEMSPQTDGSYRRGFAGDVLNALWYARKALDDDWTVSFCSAVGQDPLSDDMLAFIGGAGIDCSAVRRIAGRTPGLYLITLDGAERSFTYWRSQSAARSLAADGDWLGAQMDAARLIYVSGITLAILPEDDRARLLAGLAARRAAGATVALDPNIRPALWSDMDTARDVLTSTAAVSSIVLPSFDDEAACFGDATPDATRARYAGAGAETVIVKNGPNAVLYLQDGQSGEAASPPVARPVDTTGAGDSFNGACLAALISGEPIGRAIAAGQACAGRVIQTRGALI